MGNRLFFVSEDQRVQEMNEVNIKDMLESKLQEIVEKNPDLLAREWDDQPRKLFLVSREQKTYADVDSGNYFRLDHLLVDEKGIPLLVEVKRSTDTRIRREVAAQMLDYACRASNYKKEQLMESFQRNNRDCPDAAYLLEDEDFWNDVSDNLKDGHFRLVFVADDIPEPLRVLIEFMDRSMNDIEVYGVELKPYRTADGTMLLSTNIVGNSLEIIEKPTYSTRRENAWTGEEFLSRVRKGNGPDGANTAEALIELCQVLGLDGIFGRSKVLANFMAKKDNIIIFQIGDAWGKGSFHVDLKYRELKRLDSCRGWDNNQLRDAALSIFPPQTDTHDMVKAAEFWIPLRNLNEPDMLERFKTLLRSFLGL